MKLLRLSLLLFHNLCSIMSDGSIVVHSPHKHTHTVYAATVNINLFDDSVFTSSTFFPVFRLFIGNSEFDNHEILLRQSWSLAIHWTYRKIYRLI